MTGVYLGLDIGTSSVKAVLVDAAGSVKVVASRALDVSHPNPLWSEQNPDSWVEATIGAVDELASTHPVAVAAVRGVGLSGQMHGATLLDAAGTPLRPAILWNDGRSHVECRELEARLPALHSEIFLEKMAASKVRLLWGTASLFSNRRYMAGAATNPDPDVFAYAASQVRTALETTHRLGGQNYVLWGGREGCETLLNTDMRQELDQLGRFVRVVEHKQKIGFRGPILIEPKPKEPTKHQYDFDVATCYGFLERYGLTKEVKLNLEQNHAILAGHSFEHEIALANAFGVFGSLDINRGDDLLGWDTDQFAMNVPEMVLCFHALLKGGGFTTGGLNFDAKIRRQSIDPDDLIHAHVGSMDACARAFIAAAEMLDAGALTGQIAERYAGWQAPEAQAILAGNQSLAEVADGP
jgi:xylose isomerase